MSKLQLLCNDIENLYEKPLPTYLKFNNPPKFMATVGMANIVFYNGVYYYLPRTKRNFNLEKNLNHSLIYFSNIVDALLYAYNEYKKNYLELAKINNLSIGKISDKYLSWDKRPYKLYLGGIRSKDINELTKEEKINVKYFNSFSAALEDHLNKSQFEKVTGTFQPKPKYLFSVGLYKAIKFENNYFLISKRLKTSDIKKYNNSFSSLIKLFEFYSSLPYFITRIGPSDVIRYNNKFFCIPTKDIPIQLEKLSEQELNQYALFENIYDVFTYTSKNLY